MRSFILVSG